ncbi:MAG TPA: hypothetical protein VNK03_07395 [Gammaproteobacteria bacterium]|nr:hypothetical protein [Gammaproteobacteria bacterium]
MQAPDGIERKLQEEAGAGSSYLEQQVRLLACFETMSPADKVAAKAARDVAREAAELKKALENIAKLEGTQKQAVENKQEDEKNTLEARVEKTPESQTARIAREMEEARKARAAAYGKRLAGATTKAASSVELEQPAIGVPKVVMTEDKNGVLLALRGGPQKLKENKEASDKADKLLGDTLKASLAEVAANPKYKIGPRTIEGWTIADVPALGNCFYEAVALQLKKNNFSIATVFPATVGGTELAVILRNRSSKPYEDRDWAGPVDMTPLMKEYKFVVAIVDTREPVLQFLYHYVNSKGNYQFTQHINELPVGSLMLELVYTGAHYLSVTSKPGDRVLQRPSGV